MIRLGWDHSWSNTNANFYWQLKLAANAQQQQNSQPQNFFQCELLFFNRDVFDEWLLVDQLPLIDDEFLLLVLNFKLPPANAINIVFSVYNALVQ
jgi:hypothetical protein